MCILGKRNLFLPIRQFHYKNSNSYMGKLRFRELQKSGNVLHFLTSHTATVVHEVQGRAISRYYYCFLRLGSSQKQSRVTKLKVLYLHASQSMVSSPAPNLRQCRIADPSDYERGNTEHLYLRTTICPALVFVETERRGRHSARRQYILIHIRQAP